MVGLSPKFQSTPPCEGATPIIPPVAVIFPVSIHAPVRGGDLLAYYKGSIPQCFNPRPRARGRLSTFMASNEKRLFQSTPPCEGATPSSAIHVLPLSFQSTPPCEGATIVPAAICQPFVVSIHAPVRGGDLPFQITSITIKCFNPRPRARGRPFFSGLIFMNQAFQSTPPCEGATGCSWRIRFFTNWFQSTPPCEGAT